MSKKSCALVFGITNNYSFALVNVLLGLKKHCKVFWDDIIIYHVEVSDANQKIAQSIINCKFVNFGNNEWCNNVVKNIPQNRYSLATLFRYECFNLLNEYQKVIWSDVDILIQNDFSDIIKYGDKSGYACTMTDQFLVEANFYEPIREYNMFIPLCNAGILVLSEKLLNYDLLCQWCCDKTVQYANLLRWPDQGILNLMLQEFNIEPEEMNIIKYHCHPTLQQAKSPLLSSIVHAYGEWKFWHDTKIQPKFPEWFENNKVFIDMQKNYKVHRVEHEKLKGPMVSIVMSIYDRILYIDEAVSSILNQTFTDFEFVIVLEFSDSQSEIEEQLLKYEDERIKIIKNTKKLGFAASLNIGIDNSLGEFIARMDDDDISMQDRLKKQIEFFAIHPEISICGSFVEMFELKSTTLTFNCDPEFLKIELLARCPLMHPTIMMRKSDLIKYNLRYTETPPGEIYAEDYDLWARAVEFVKIANIPEVLLKYRASGENITANNILATHKNTIKIMKMQFNKYLQMNPTDDEMYLFSWRLRHLVNNQSVATEILNNFHRKIIEANEESCFYNHEKLIQYVMGAPAEAKHKVNIFKKLCKKIIKTLYYKIFNRIMANANDYFMPRIEANINNVRNDINKMSGELVDIKTQLINLKNNTE